MQTQYSQLSATPAKRSSNHMQYVSFESTLSEHHQLFSQYHTARTTGGAALARALATRYLPFSCYHLEDQIQMTESEFVVTH